MNERAEEALRTAELMVEALDSGDIAGARALANELMQRAEDVRDAIDVGE